MDLKLADNYTWKNLDSCLVLLNLNTSDYYTLNETASIILRGIIDKLSKNEIQQKIQAEFECQSSEVESDIDDQISFLTKEGILIPET